MLPFYALFVLMALTVFTKLVLPLQVLFELQSFNQSNGIDPNYCEKLVMKADPQDCVPWVRL